MKTLEQLQKELDAPIPRSAVKEREGARGMTYSYLSADYVVDRMNALFGNLNWACDTLENKAVYTDQLNGKHMAHYIARVKIEAQHIDEQGRVIRTQRVGTGYGEGYDAYSPGKAHELAAKEAESDGLKRACKNLGQSMGLALYDKDQTNVVDDAPKKEAAPASSNTSSERQPFNRDEKQPRPKAAPSDRENLNKAIYTLSKIVINKGLSTLDGLREEMKSKYGTDDKEKLSDEQAKEFKALLDARARGAA